MGDVDITIERGTDILRVFEERQRFDAVAVRVDLEEEFSRARNPFGLQEPEHFSLGNFGHEHAERLVPRLPKGLDKEVKLELADGKVYRMDRVDHKNGVIYEVKPDTAASIKKGEEQVKIYCEWMDRNHPRPNGKKWVGKVVTYDKKAVRRFLKSIGWFDKQRKHNAATKKAKPRNNALRQKFLVPLATAGALGAASAKTAEADNRPAATMTNRVQESSRGVDPPQRLTNQPTQDQRLSSGPTSRIRTPPDASPTPATPVSPPAVSPAAGAPAPAAPSAPKTGSVTMGTITIDYDLRDPKNKKAFKVRNMNFGGFPTKDSKLVRFSQSPYVKAGTAGASVLLSFYVDRPIFPLDIIKAHFSSVIQSARERLDELYPPSAQVWDDAHLHQHETTFQAISDVLQDGSYLAAKSREEIVSDLEGVFAYQDALLAAYVRVTKQLMPELPALHDDIVKRADVLGRIARNLESAFEQIHTSVIGAVPMVYYESFTLWNVRTVMFDLSREMSGLGGAVYSRQSEYARLAQKIDEKLLAADATFNAWREMYEKNKRLIGK